MRTALAAISVAVIVLLSAAPSDAARGTRKQCKQTCGPRIAQDCAPFTKRARRACKRAILRACRRAALESCFLTPAPVDTTTTTTSLAPATSTLVSTTSTTITFLVPTTTSKPTTSQTPTTAPPATTTTLFHYGGDWTLFSELVAQSEECAAGEPYLDVDVVVSHAPGAADIVAAIEFEPVLYGAADAGGFDVEGIVVNGDCTHSVVLSAEPSSSSDRMLAAVVIDDSCPEERCVRWYLGDLER